jgi:hypothetical protein
MGEGEERQQEVEKGGSHERETTFLVGVGKNVTENF